MHLWRWWKTLRCTPHPTRLTPGHLPPRGKALVRGNLVGAEGNAPGRRGHAPRPTKGTPPCLPLWGRCPVRTLGGEGFPSPPPRNESGDTQWCGFIARVAGSNCQRPPAAPSQAASPPALPEGEPSWGLWCGGTWWGRWVTHRGGGGMPPPYERHVSSAPNN